MINKYEIRAVLPSDKEQLLVLSEFLNSVNLPHDAGAVAQIAERSEKAFSGEQADPTRRQYVFAIHDLENERIVGTSMIIGQLGRKDAPYIYLSVIPKEKYSPTQDKHFRHRVLRMGYSYDGPTEIGGLVMHPDYRRDPARLGMLISYVRFLFMRMNREAFRDEVLAELLPPFGPNRTSHLWEAVGRRFTEMDYSDADRLSKTNKQFIRNLFPDGDIYASLLSAEAQAVIGQVGPDTRGVEKILRRIGFRYIDRIDPFDGGPHFMAKTDEVTLVKNTRSRVVEVGEVTNPERVLLGRSYLERPWFRALPAFCELQGDRVRVEPEVAAHLNLSDRVWVLPLRARS